MPDAIWYGRLFVWIGALVLLIEAIAGRSNGLTTAIAMLMVIAGLASLLYGIFTDRATAASPDDPVSNRMDDVIGR